MFKSKLRKKICSIICSAGLILPLCGTWVSANTALNEESVVYYENTFDNGKASITEYSDKYGEFSFGSNLDESEFNENKGIAAKEGSWGDKSRYVFNDDFKVNTGILTVSFDISRKSRSNDANKPSVLLFNDASGDTRYAFWIFFDKMYGPKDELSGYGDSSIYTDNKENTVYSIKEELDFDNKIINTYVNGELLSQKKLAADFVLKDITFSLSMTAAYADNFKISHSFARPVEVYFDSGNIGNIFFDSEELTFDLLFKNKTLSKTSRTYDLAVTDINGNTVYSAKTEKVNLDAEDTKSLTIKLPQLKYGMYVLHLTDECGKEFTCDFSRCVINRGNNARIGVASHFYESMHKSGDSEKLMELADKAGFGYTRSDWPRILDESGNLSDYLDTNPKFSTYITQSNIRGIKMLGHLTVSQGSDSDGGLNTDQSHIEALESYCKQMAEKYKGVIDYFEIGNEIERGTNNDNTPIPAKDYVTLLKAAYNGIKAGNESAKVIAFSSSGMNSTTESFIKDALDIMKEDGKFYFDAISIHPYHGIDVPENTYFYSGMNWKDHSDKLKAILKKYEIEDKECWASETGGYTGTVSPAATFADQALYSARQMVLNEVYDMYEHLFFYNLQDFGLDDNAAASQRYGIIKNWDNVNWYTQTAYAAKASYLVISYFNSILNNAVYQSSASDDNVSRYIFKNASGEKVEFIWDTDGKDTDFFAEVDATDTCVSVYDMYGNLLTNKSGEKFSVKAEREPKVVIYENFAVSTLLNGKSVSSFENAKEGDTITFVGDTSYVGKSFIVAQYDGGCLKEIKVEATDESGGATTELTHKKMRYTKL